MALGTLTVVPVRPPERIDRAVAGAAMLWTPLAGLVLGVLAGAVTGVLLWLGATPLLAGVGAVGVLAWASRGLHLDGLADTADGLGASWDRARALTVMRSGDAGPFAVVTLLLVVLAQVAAVAAVAGRVGPWQAGVLVGAAVVAGRAVLVLVCAAGWPPARPEGLGAAVARSVRPVPAALVTTGTLVVVAAVAAGAALAAGSTGTDAATDAVWVAAAAAFGWLAALTLVRHVVRRIGGTTGDVLGAAVETATAACLLVLAVTG